ncbi:Os01g0201850, partial [Oryza sativa Japonica Group]
RGFLEVFFLAAWHIWKQRNGLIFQNIRPSFQALRSLFVKEVLLHMCRM